MKRAVAVFVIMAAVLAFAENPHITQLIELIDVAISSPADGQVLTFDSARGKWTNRVPHAQRIDFNQLLDSQTVTVFTADETANYRVTVTGETALPVSMFLHTSSSSSFVGTISPKTMGAD